MSDNFGSRRPDGSPRININPEPSQPFDLFEPQRTIEQESPSLRERINDILLPDEDTIPDVSQIDMGNDPCCDNAREMWYGLLEQSGITRDDGSDILNGYDEMDCEEFEATLRDFAGDMPGKYYKNNVTDRARFEGGYLPPTEFHHYARQVLDAWDGCKFEGQNTPEAQDMGFYASEDAFEVGWNAILKYSEDDAPFERLVSTFSGMGAPETAAMRVGAKPALSIDGWDESIRTLNENYPGEHKQIWMGGEGGSVEDVLGHIHDATTGADSWAYHGSPPCTDISSANPNCDPDKAMEMMRFNDALMSGMRGMENPPSLMTTEQAKEMRPLLLEGNHGLSQEFMDAVRSSPLLESGMFGSPSIRQRMYAVEGAKATPQITGRGNYRSINDLFPDMAGEWEESENRPAQLAHLARLGKVGQKAFNMLAEPTISMGGSINPGKGGAPWTDEKQAFAWKHIHPTRRAVPSVTHHRPALTHVRKLTRPEVMQIQGWTPEEAKAFNFPQRDNQGYQHTENTRQNIIDTQLGNTLNPNIMENIFRNVQPRRVA